MNFGLTDISKLPAVFITEIRGGSLNKYQFNTVSIMNNDC